MTHSKRPWIRAAVSSVIVVTLIAVWVYQVFAPGTSPDTILTMFVFVTALAAVTHFYGRRAVRSALDTLGEINPGDETSEPSDGGTDAEE